MKLTTSYLGLTLEHPIVASASPLTKSMEGLNTLRMPNRALL